MSASQRICFAVGVPVESLLGSPPYESTVPRTKYREDTGAPYQVNETKRFMKLTNGTEVQGALFGGWCIDKAFEGTGIQLTGSTDCCQSVAGITLHEGRYVDVRGGLMEAVELPAIKAEDAQRAYDLLTKAGFPVAQSDIKVYAVLDVSY